jgi:hypothetical protein
MKRRVGKMYKPESVKGSFGLYGVVKIFSIENGKVKVAFYETDREGNLSEATIKVFIKAEDCFPVAKVGTWSAQLSSKHDKLYQIRPTSGVFPGKFKEFVSKKDQPPMPTMSGGKIEFQHLIFRPLFVLNREDVKDMVVGYQYGLDYAFATDESGLVKYGKQLDRSTHMQDVDDFLTKVGVWDKGEMKYSDNLLPHFHRRAVDADKSLMIHVEKGFVKTLISDMSDESFDDHIGADGIEE